LVSNAPGATQAASTTPAKEEEKELELELEVRKRLKGVKVGVGE